MERVRILAADGLRPVPGTRRRRAPGATPAASARAGGATWAAVLVLAVAGLGCAGRARSERGVDARAPSEGATTPRLAERPPPARPTGAPRTRAGEDLDGGPRVFFIGNSFTRQGPVPVLVGELARAAGFARVEVAYRAVDGQSLAWHRTDSSPEGAPARLREGWDVVVLQDYSTRSTDALGDPAGFAADVAWFSARARAANPAVRVILYETWARAAGHPLYGSAFSSPAAMQGELRRHTAAAAEGAALRGAGGPAPVRSEGAGGGGAGRLVVAPVGDAWELALGRDPTLRLHGPDDYHAGSLGQYLSACVLFSTIFERPAIGLPALDVAEGAARQLQLAADAVTGFGRGGAPPVAPRATSRVTLAANQAPRPEAMADRARRLHPVDLQAAPPGV